MTQEHNTTSAPSEIPDHLRPFIATQDPSLYTPIDHASWRYILRVSRAFFVRTAHPKYLNGLVECGISTERIPLVREMDEKLKRFGWRAVPVSGFIPPAVFMEFQSLGILPIACEMRTLEHLAYTPAPDIVHEAAGHAPILADPEYAAYLRRYGEVARKAIFSSKDMAVYEAVRALSDLKEDPRASVDQISRLERDLEEAVSRMDYLSEATLLARMNWWTVEYGLVGTLEHPQIYGAGLLSSVGESYNCLSNKVRKLPFDLGCIEQAYDITRPQPQLFVARDFNELGKVLDEFAATMAYRQGGQIGLDQAIRAEAVCTLELDSGLQISGIVAPGSTTDFVHLQGPAQLAYRDQELEGHSPKYHAEGYSTPLGRVRGAGKPLSSLGRSELESMGLRERQAVRIEFENGVSLEGVLKSRLEKDGKTLVLAFERCTVRRGGEILFRPEWGTFDLGCGEAVRSVFGGAGDRRAYLAAVGGFEQRPRRPKSNLTEANRELNNLYSRVRRAREEAIAGSELQDELDSVHSELERKHPGDWLLRLELLELLHGHGLRAEWEDELQSRLTEIAEGDPTHAEMIERGLRLLE